MEVMIRAVIFDCFGVLTTDGWLAFCEKYFDEESEEYDKAIASNKRVDAGLIGCDNFIDEVALLAGVSRQVALESIEGNTTNEKIFTYIKDTIKPKYKLGILSNAGANWLDELFQPWQVELFDEIVLSYQIGSTKPDKIMYQTIADKLGVLLDECIYVDDQERYVQGARDVGMHAIHFDNTRNVMTKIEELIDA